MVLVSFFRSNLSFLIFLIIGGVSLSFLENIHVIAFRCSNDASLGRIRSNATANQMGIKIKISNLSFKKSEGAFMRGK